jgi:hypothetical protein
MHRILLRAPGLTGELAVDLLPAEALLLGRDPDPARLPAGLLPPGTPPARAVRVPSSQVSGNHLLVWSTREGARVQDLGSKNGTALVMVPGEAVLAGGVRVILELGPRSPEAAAAPRGPAPAEWTEPEGYGAAVERSVVAFLGEAGLDARVSRATSPSLPATSPPPAGQGAHFHLSDGDQLSVAPPEAATLDTRWPALLGQVASFIEEQNALFDQELGHDEGFILCSPRFREAHRRVHEAAQRGRRLLLLGPSGSGKERLAECYHRHSRRHDGPFKPVHCGLIEKEMIFIQLFGSARGSFTGSVRDAAGAVEAAHGGTLFLDEVAELNPRVQTALLRFLDRRGEYERLGETRARHADVQIVAATSVDLRQAVGAGTFREDLWYRFTGSVVQVPPLRERPLDLLAFLRGRQLTPGLSAYDALSAPALERVLAHGWPGNFRELDNFVARLPAVRARGIDEKTCLAALAEGTTGPSFTPASPSPDRASFRELAMAAAAAYAEDHAGGAPARLGDIKDFVDGYLKPLFVAHGCGLADRSELPAGVNYSALARALDIADGTTVKRSLQRYFERYRRLNFSG